MPTSKAKPFSTEAQAQKKSKRLCRSASVCGKLVDNAGCTMEGIANSIKRVTDIMSEITAASQEQSAGIGEVNRAITHMDEMTQQMPLW